ncbi:SGNH hydrolase domain-containing protein [Paraconexibacter sp. AEG42_29]|uniref:SGNH hydrolase domain-containing protein n=1 Tax=Paraconexibacter sp. AEG42_29 TaxID=2997339 RepID=UPI00339D90A7
MRRPGPRHRRRLSALAGGVLAATALAISGQAPAQEPAPAPSFPAQGDPQSPLGQPCFGAAAVDPNKPCSNPGLALTVYPLPREARALQKTQGCDHRESAAAGLLDICFFGATPREATRTVALLGDSHAAHWRNALDTVLAKHTWRAISIQRAGCPLTLARPNLPSPDRISGCMNFNKAVQAWMAAHPEIDVVFTSQHRGTVIPRKGVSQNAARHKGYIKAWQGLLSNNVRQIVVIRDTPRISSTTIACVQGAIDARVPPGEACALKSSYALRSDPAVEAARIIDTPQVQVADLGTFFCRKRMCPPVSGGALILRDVTHMTTTYSTTLGPYLLQRVDKLMESWPALRR